jgi:hypothetical protein
VDGEFCTRDAMRCDGYGTVSGSNKGPSFFLSSEMLDMIIVYCNYLDDTRLLFSMNCPTRLHKVNRVDRHQDMTLPIELKQTC